MSRCLKNPEKHRRVCQGHGKNNTASEGTPHKIPLRKHKWEGHGADRQCVHCKIKPKANKGAKIISPPYYFDVEYRAKLDAINDQIKKEVEEDWAKKLRR